MNTEERKREITDKIFNFRPIFFAAVFLCLGIFFSYLRLKDGISVWWLLLWLPVAIVPFFFVRAKEKILARLRALLLLLIAFSVGAAAFALRIDAYTSGGVYNERTTVSGTVVEKYENAAYPYVVLRDVTIGEREEKGKLIAYLPTSFLKNLQLSDVVLLTGKVDTHTEAFEDGALDTYSIGDDVRFTLRALHSYSKAGESFDLFLFVRQRIEKVVYAGMDETPAAVTMAVLTGDTTGIDGDLLDNVRMGGIAHIFAVSGLHVGSLYAFCLLLLSRKPFSKLNKPLCFTLLAALLLFYAGVCGFSASVVRATVICLVAYAAKLLGLETDFLQSLGLAAMIILMFSPTSLFEVGFLLSFSACLGLALFSRPLKTAFYALGRWVGNLYIKIFHGGVKARPRPPQADDDTAPLEIWQRALRASVSFLSASFAAQIATAPIQMIAFGYVSGWGLLLNCIFVPLISVAFSLLLAFVAVACLLPTAFAFVILYVPSVVWSAVLLLFEAFDFSSSISCVLSWSSVISYYGGWQFLSDKWNISKRQKYILSLACFLAFGITVYALNV